jgi:triosephosphate isomerase
MFQLEELKVEGRTVFLRVDFNVPLTEEGEIRSDARIRATIPTIRYLLSRKAKIVIASHLGRPKGKIVPGLSLKPIARRLSELLGQEVIMAPDVIGPEVFRLKTDLKPGDILLLENLRFREGETANDPEFARQLAQGISCFVNDAFSSCHRSHASVVGITLHVHEKAAGYLLRKEVEFLKKAVEGAQKPYVAILGGSKVSDKIAVIENLMKKADSILIGGAMAYTFFYAQGYAIGRSFVEDDKLALAKSLLQKAKEKGVDFYLPLDHLLTASLEDATHTRIVDAFPFPPDMMAVDIGPKTVDLYSWIISRAKTIVWNGPLGIFEKEAFAGGTLKIAEAVAISTGTTIIGGGDSEAAVAKLGLSNKITHISLGGGATLEYLANETLPGLEALDVGFRRFPHPKIPLVAGNWKMNKTIAEAKSLLEGILAAESEIADAEVVVAPPYVALSEAEKILGRSSIRLAGQDVFWEERGAYTGEVSAAMLLDIGCRYCIIGHSERRQQLGETDEIVNRKVKAALKHGITPILCIGETLKEREQGKTMEVISLQVHAGLAGVEADEFRFIVTAYEPVWAIGTGKTATPEQAEGVHAFIRDLFKEKYGNGLASCAIILYGGSVNPANSFSLLREKNIDGFLVGGASLEAGSFVEISREAVKAYKEKKK